MFVRSLVIGAMLAVGAVGTAAAEASAAAFPFEPIAIKRINLPANIKEATRPLFTNDGKHLLFWFDDELWITTLEGKDVSCLSCGEANSPRSPGEDLATPFPDGKRVFFGGYKQPGAGQMAVLECAPSVIDCKTKKVLPVDFSPSQPTAIPPGGAQTVAQGNLLGSATPKLSQDGLHVGFSDLRSDSLLNMVVGKLRRAGDKYEVVEPRVLNPQGPKSATDPNIAAWSDSGALFEFKSFINGGRDATYVQVGGIQTGVDVWSVNLATGKRTRLTAHPDWDEDNAVSPNGELMALYTGRTMNFTDWVGGLLPVREFIRAPLSVMSSGAIGGNKMCHPPMWLLPASGDQGGTLAGQPIVSYAYKNVTVTNNLTGSAQWSPDGTKLALNTNLTTEPYIRDRGKNAPFLLVANLTSRKGTKAARTVSSDVGSWAPTPTDYHGALGFKGTVTLKGPRGGTVTLTYAGAPGPGVFLDGEWSETYKDYSDNGKDFVNGTSRIDGLLDGSYSSHLTMTGSRKGRHDAEMTYAKLMPRGKSKSTLDGKSVSGPQPEQIKAGACPNMLPDKPALRVTSSSLGNGAFKVKVTASVAGMGDTETAVDTRPVNRAAIKLGNKTTFTNAQGVATVKVTGSRKLTVTAGDTLEPTSASLRGS
jgi:hypothetical protein